MVRALRERAPTVAAARPGYDDITFEECDSRPEPGTDRGWVKNRYVWCERVSVPMEIIDISTGRVAGRVNLHATLIFYGWNGIRNVQ